MSDQAAALALPAPLAAPLDADGRAAERGLGALRIGNTAYDLLGRIPAVLVFGYSTWTNGHDLLVEAGGLPAPGTAAVVPLLAHAASVGFTLMVTVAMALRRPPILRRGGVLPRIAALGGAFSLVFMMSCPKADMAPDVAALSFALILAGNAVAYYALSHLGRALSIMAEARHLVTSGPYRLVRHPLYAAEAVISLGLLLQFLPFPALPIWLAHIGLQLYRMHYEEQVLREAFPSYAAYARGTARIVPGVF